MTKKANIIIISLFTAFIGLFFVINIVLPDREFSERENRYLQQAPAFSLKALFSGDFTSDFETCTTDQFVLRDDWTTLKARCELLMGKKENNGVYYCADGMLITRFKAPADSVIDTNTAYINELVKNVNVPVYFTLIPGKSEIEAACLPAHAPNDSQKSIIDRAYAQSSAKTLDMDSELTAHAGEYIFYRTDHHWTSLGAYYGSQVIRGAMDLPSKGLDSYTPSTVSDKFYGTVYSASGFSWVKPDSIQTFVPDDGSAAVTSYQTGQAVPVGLYNTSFLSMKDKYSMFLGGNTPRLVIKTANTKAPKLLIIRDSFTDSLAPFLMDSFSEIDLLDMRYFRGSVKEYAAAGGFDSVLVIYSVDTFCTDTNLFLLGM